jgi:hypothetical protein
MGHGRRSRWTKSGRRHARSVSDITVPSARCSRNGGFANMGESEMVSVSRSYAAGYPKLVDFVSNELTKVPQKPKVYNAFMKYAEYTHFWEGNFIFFAHTDPQIQIEDLNTHSKNGDYIFAKYKHVFPRYVFLDVKWAKRFEKDYQLPQAQLLMEACILHEMVHRGDLSDEVEQTLEPGEEFEKAAYGSIQGKYWTGPI